MILGGMICGYDEHQYNVIGRRIAGLSLHEPDFFDIPEKQVAGWLPAAR